MSNNYRSWLKSPPPFRFNFRFKLELTLESDQRNNSQNSRLCIKMEISFFTYSNVHSFCDKVATGLGQDGVVGGWLEGDEKCWMTHEVYLPGSDPHAAHRHSAFLPTTLTANQDDFHHDDQVLCWSRHCQGRPIPESKLWLKTRKPPYNSLSSLYLQAPTLQWFWNAACTLEHILRSVCLPISSHQGRRPVSSTLPNPRLPLCVSMYPVYIQCIFMH